MTIETILRPPACVLTLAGRLDAFTARTCEEWLQQAQREPGVRHLVLDVGKLDYLSSAGVRLFVAAQRQLRQHGGELHLVNLKGYAEKVLALAGFADSFPRHASPEAALAAASQSGDSASETRWNRAVPFDGEAGGYQFSPASREPCRALVLGSVADVLHCRVNAARMRAKRFSATEYSLGLGGLGATVADCLGLLGEMMTIGGTMVWLPTDGHDTADYLIPKKDTGEVTIRTAFNVSLAGHFNELVRFQSARPEGAAVGDIYRDLFTFARQRRPGFKGGIFTAMRAEVHAAYGAGVLRSPIEANRPANGKALTDPANYDTWFEVDHAPRHRDVTGLLTGFGLDLRSNYSVHYDAAMLDAAFYVNPGNRGASSDQMLHNHGVFFSPLPWHPQPRSLEDEIRAVVADGDFRDMRHVFDNTRLVRAVIGVAYLEAFAPDLAGGA